MKIASDFENAIVDPNAYADGAAVDEAFAWFRREAPFVQVEPDGYDPFWLVTRHADILEAERRADLFCSGERQSILTTKAALRARDEIGFTGARVLTQMDPPDHAEFRRLTQGWFMPKNLRNLEPRIRRLAREAVDRMAAFDGRCDFARDVALLYPLRVIMEILGVPAADEPFMLKLTQEMFGPNDPEMSRTGDAPLDEAALQANLRNVVADFSAYFSDLIADRRRAPGEDLASTIANGRIHGEEISLGDAIGYYIITATAGHDTTSNTVSAGLWALAEAPHLLARLKTEPGLIASHVDESVRWATAVKHFMRTATADVEFAGGQVRKGDWMMISYASGNRDEAVFERPFHYDIGRSPNRHVAFGYGPHVCLGQHLGQLEMRIFWEELLPRLDGLELAGAPQRTRANFVCGPKSVPVRYEMS